MVVQCNESIHIVHIHIFRSITTNKQNKEKKERKRKQKRKNTAIHVNVHFYPSPDMPWYFGLDIRWKVSVVRPSRPATVFLKSISHATKSRISRCPSERNSNRSLLKIVHSNSTVSSYCFLCSVCVRVHASVSLKGHGSTSVVLVHVRQVPGEKVLVRILTCAIR